MRFAKDREKRAEIIDELSLIISVFEIESYKPVASLAYGNDRYRT